MTQLIHKCSNNNVHFSSGIASMRAVPHFEKVVHCYCIGLLVALDSSWQEYDTFARYMAVSHCRVIWTWKKCHTYDKIDQHMKLWYFNVILPDKNLIFVIIRQIEDGVLRYTNTALSCDIWQFHCKIIWMSKCVISLYIWQRNENMKRWPFSIVPPCKNLVPVIIQQKKVQY